MVSKSAPSIQRIAELQQFIADYARVLRMPHLADTGRRENDVEHSFGLALTCWFLAPKIAPELSLEKILRYALVHDLVELYAGDTFVFGPPELVASKAARETAALRKIKRMWPDFKELADSIDAYERKVDEEALFVYSADKLLPVLMINLGEKDKYWTRHKITLDAQIAEKIEKIRASKNIAPYLEQFVEWISHPDYFYKPAPELKRGSDRSAR